jgi:alpha-1,6-mannosyltransferase
VGTAGKLAILGGVSLPIYCVSFRWDFLLPPPPWAPGWYQVEVFLLFIPYCLALRLIWRRAAPTLPALIVLLASALLFRLPLLSTEPRLSTDLYRYLWDGRVQMAGINPYRYPPEDEALCFLRDDTVYQRINRKEFPTIYPAGAQLIFWAAAARGLTTPARFKALLLLADCGAILLLLRLLDCYQLNRLRILLYAWNPLVVYETAQAGHLETIVVLCVVAALLAAEKQRVNLAFVSLAFATSVKLYPALLAAVFVRGRVGRCVLIFAAVLFCAYAPYLAGSAKILGFLPRYFSDPDEITNLGLPSLLFAVLSPPQAGWILRLIVAGVAVWIFFRSNSAWAKSDASGNGGGSLNLPSRCLLSNAYLLVSVHTLLLYPALYPWYLLWLIALLCIFPSPGWLYFSCASAFVYTTWPTPSWVLWLEYAPLYVLLGVEMARQWRTSRALPVSLRTSRFRPNG